MGRIIQGKIKLLLQLHKRYEDNLIANCFYLSNITFSSSKRHFGLNLMLLRKKYGWALITDIKSSLFNLMWTYLWVKLIENIVYKTLHDRNRKQI